MKDNFSELEEYMKLFIENEADELRRRFQWFYMYKNHGVCFIDGRDFSKPFPEFKDWLNERTY